jgi:hypothetical protein
VGPSLVAPQHCSAFSLPLQIVEGSGRFADVIAYAWRMLHDTTSVGASCSFRDLKARFMPLLDTAKQGASQKACDAGGLSLVRMSFLKTQSHSPLFSRFSTTRRSRGDNAGFDQAARDGRCSGQSDRIFGGKHTLVTRRGHLKQHSRCPAARGGCPQGVWTGRTRIESLFTILGDPLLFDLCRIPTSMPFSKYNLPSSLAMWRQPRLI